LLAFVGYPKLVPAHAPLVPCREPLTYRFGEIDPHFDITKKELRDIMKEVEHLWSTAMGRNLLNYSKNGRVVIHLVYGEDQQRTETEKTLSNRIEQMRERVQMSENRYKNLMDTYNSQKDDLDNTISEFKNLVKGFNAAIAKWQTKGGVPKSKQSEIKESQHRINYLKYEIKQKQQATESTRHRLNQKSEHLNSLIDRQNKMISDYNDRFSEPKKFDQGRYIKKGDSEKINIFQFSNRAELKTVLAHESGHAMGLSHVDNPKSIMNAIMEKQDIFHLKLTKEDIAAIRNRCQ
jgi:hypothetical protein